MPVPFREFSRRPPLSSGKTTTSASGFMCLSRDRNFVTQPCSAEDGPALSAANEPAEALLRWSIRSLEWIRNC